MPKTVLTVFLSSTGKDLDAYRQELRRQITGCELLKCVCMEDFGPQDAEAPDYCQKAARDADIFIGIVGHRRGWEPVGDSKQRSITEMEYEASKEHGRPRFIAIAPDDFPVPGHLREPDEVNARQVAFRSRVGGERVAGVNNFKLPEALAAEFVTKLLSHVISSDLIKHVRPDLAAPQGTRVEVRDEQAPAIAAAFEKLAEDEQVDLLEMARNPKGIDIADLESKLVAQAEQHVASSIEERRKAAEYWRHVGALAFLNDTQKAMAAFRKAVALDPDDPVGLSNLARLLVRVGALSEAEGLYRQSLQQNAVLGRKVGMASDSGDIGIIYQMRGDLDRAEDMYRQSLVLNEELGRKQGMANQYGNLGTLYEARGSLDQAEEMHRKSLALEEALGRREGMACDYGNLGNVYLARGDLDQAEEMHLRCLALEDELGRKEGMANAYGNLGNVYSTRGDLDRAKEMHRKSLALNETLGRKQGIASAYTNLGIISEEQGDAKEAIAFWVNARELFAAVGMRNEIEKLDLWINDTSST